MAGIVKSLGTLIEDAVNVVLGMENGASGKIDITISAERGTSVRIVVDQKTKSLTSFQQEASQTEGLSDKEASILKFVQECRNPPRGKEIAVGIGERYTSHFREVLSDLCNRGLLSRSVEGYSVVPPSANSFGNK